jgi:hypothetical protein
LADVTARKIFTNYRQPLNLVEAQAVANVAMVRICRGLRTFPQISFSSPFGESGRSRGIGSKCRSKPRLAARRLHAKRCRREGRL